MSHVGSTYFTFYDLLCLYVKRSTARNLLLLTYKFARVLNAQVTAENYGDSWVDRSVHGALWQSGARGGEAEARRPRLLGRLGRLGRP